MNQWLIFCCFKATVDEDMKYAEMKNELRLEIREMRRQLQKMMADNEELAAIEKLPRHEFDLDIEEQKRLQAICEHEVEKVDSSPQMVAPKILGETLHIAANVSSIASPPVHLGQEWTESERCKIGIESQRNVGWRFRLVQFSTPNARQRKLP